MDTESTTPSRPARAPKRFGPVALVVVALLSAGLAAAAVLVASAAWRSTSPVAAHEDDSAVYQCPMHPSVVQDHPGTCPICGMKLVKVDKGASRAPASDVGQRRILFYRSPMDPKQTSPTPRKDGMGMDYLPVYEDEASTSSAVSGLATIDIDPARQQLIGLKTVEVTEGPVGGAWRTVGRVAIDETRVRHVNVKVGGFVERIFVDFVGKKVKRGDPLFSLYSPELLAAQEEYLVALRTKGALAEAGAAVTNDGDALVAAARRKLSLWDVPTSELDRIARTRETTKTLTFYSPAAGVVTKKDVVEGMKLDAGAMPYEIVDLSSVWVLADVYESELRFVTEGMGARLKLNAFPDREFDGKVVFVDPLLDPQTRTVKVRLTFSNPTGEIRPEMFGEVVLLGRSHDGLRIPPDAVVDSGTQKVVFVAIGEGKFQPRTVELGESDGSHVEVLSGLAPGDRVVTRANFLVDSESRLRASLSEMSPGTTTHEHAPESARVLPGVSAPNALPSGTQASPTEPSAPPPSHRGHRP